MSSRRSFALAFALCALVAVAAAGQSPADPPPAASGEPPEETFFERLDVTLVNLEVFVTDRSGRRVNGLTRDDFEVFEDGRPVEITHFYAVEDGRRRDADEAVATPEASPPVEPLRLEVSPPELPAAAGEVPEDQRLHLVLYFDNLHLRPFSRNRVVAQVRQFVASTLRPSDRAMLVTFERTLHVRYPFSTDRAALARALDGIEKLTGFAVQGASDRVEAFKRLQMSRNFSEAESHVDAYAKSVYQDLESSLQALKDLVGSLAGLPGRKAILYVSDGLPMTAGEDLFYLLDQEFGSGTSGQLLAARYRAQRRFQELTAAANANRVTFYTLEAEGMRAHSSLSAESAGRNGTSYLEADVVRDANYLEPLVLMAEETGGLAAVNTNNLTGALDNLAEDLSSYYSLAYRPPLSTDGRYHTVEVKTRDRRLQVRHRSGYRAKTPSVLIEEGTLAAALHGVGSNPIGLDLAFGREVAQEQGRFRVPIAVRIPIGKMTLIPYSGIHRATARVAVAATDGDGGVSPVHQETVPIEIPDGDLETARDQHFVYSIELLMRGGRQEVAVGLRDEASGETSFLSRPIDVGR